MTVIDESHSFMIKNLTLKFGKSPIQPAEILPSAPVTVFVGPNNSGKTLCLSEISRFCESGTQDQQNKIVENIEFEIFGEERAGQLLDKVSISPTVSPHTVSKSQVIVGNSNNYPIEKSYLLKGFANPNLHKEIFCENFLRFFKLHLDGPSRIRLVNDQQAGDLQLPGTNGLQKLFRDDDKRIHVRKIIFDAFGLYLVVDPTNVGYLRLRLSEHLPTSEVQERGLLDETVKFHNNASLIHEAGDGVKAFVGIIMEIVTGDPAVLLIDEPEAFLHPALAFKLGKEVANTSSETNKCVFVSTHSPDFVMGCIQSGVSVNIVRLTYQQKIPTARRLDNLDLLPLMRNPLLRSTNVLRGIFYEFVVVTEGDSDRAFYQEINERLLRSKPEMGIANCLFLNAQNKQTVSDLLRPLRNLGIPVATIVDLDVLKEGGKVWKKFLKGGFFPELEHNSLADFRCKVHQKLEIKNAYGNGGGIDKLNDSNREAAENLCSKLAEYGLFLVKEGELECWLPELCVTGYKSHWLIEVFKKMGEDPNDENYLQPNNSGVWSFIGNVRSWLVNSNRKGIPA